MNIRLTIGRKIGAGFGALIILTIVIFMLTQVTLDKSHKISEHSTAVLTPSVDELQQLKMLVVNSKLLITTWVYYQSAPENPDKQRLKTLIENDFGQMKDTIDHIAHNKDFPWNQNDIDTLNLVYTEIDNLFSQHDYIMMTLSDFSAYDDAESKFICQPMVEEGGDIYIQTDIVLGLIDRLVETKRSQQQGGTREMLSSFSILEMIVLWCGVGLVIGGILIASFTVRSIVKPVQKIKNLLGLLGKGVIPEETINPRSDEIGQMQVAYQSLVEGFKGTTEFAKQVGSGNYSSDYHPLSEEDALGHALLRMRADLHVNEEQLQEKVRQRTKKIEEQKKEIEELLKHVTDSIKYAKRIQQAILPPKDFVDSILPNSFVLFKPKDIVSGDFYWVHEKHNKAIIAAIDCTGHGVPGAFMTIIGHNGLNQALSNVTEVTPAGILDELNKEVSRTLRNDAMVANKKAIKDGMDAAMCVMDYKTNQVQFAGAYNPLYLVRNGDVEEIKGNKFPIGEFIGEKQKFTNHVIDLQPGDTVYIFSDGYADQFGGPKGKKFMYRKFRELLLEIKDFDMDEQKRILNQRIEEWKGDLEQVDDILIIGLHMPKA